jgi:glycosyltransferase involved in cell wall biosynthesis
MKNKTICFYAVATELGGAEKSLLDLLLGFQKISKPWVILPKAQGGLIDELIKNGIPFTVVEMPRVVLGISRKNKSSIFGLITSFPAMILYLFRLNQEIKKINPSIIHTTGLKCHLIAPWIGFIRRVPVLWHIRDIFSGGIVQKLLFWTKNAFNVNTIAISKISAEPFQDPSKVTKVIYDGIHPDVFYPNKSNRYHDLFPGSEDCLMVGMVGVFAQWKGQLEFIEAAKILMDRKVKVKLVMVGGEIYDTSGESSLTQKYQNKVNSLKLENDLKFTGFEKNTPLIMNSIDILVHASIQPEPLGRVIIEGMACECSMVVSKWGAAQEFFKDQVHGLMMNPRNPVEIANAIQWMVNHPLERKQMLLNAKNLFLEKFTQSHCDQEVQQVILEIISNYDKS